MMDSKGRHRASKKAKQRVKGRKTGPGKKQRCGRKRMDKGPEKYCDKGA
jgi:ribosomal protein L19E